MLQSLCSLARVLFFVVAFLLLAPRVRPQDASTGAIRGTALDPDARSVPSATIAVVNSTTGASYSAVSDSEGHGQDALVAGRPATVQNSYAPSSERGPSVTDQRHRFALSAIDEPQSFGRDHALLAKFFSDWKLSGVLTIGSGRPVDARVTGDPSQDGNDSNDRIPELWPHAFLGPDYTTADLRLTRRLYVRPRYKLELVAEAFNA